MPGSDATTSLQRTYRYLRLAIAGAVVVFTAVLVAMPAVGLLPSLSHYYYTSANTMFVGALIAVTVGLTWWLARDAFLRSRSPSRSS